MVNVITRFNQLRDAMDEAYVKFDRNPTQANSDAYGMALGEFQDFCVEFTEGMIKNCPEMVSTMYIEEEQVW